MTNREKLKALVQLGVSAAKIGEPLHRSTISKWLNGERNLSLENEELIEQAFFNFKQKVNEILKE
ncbi:MAG: helix-turn-helix transcriptional regulator [Clostridia bacterium]|nr:helix-turn-helix transcriptional regulator [Clostridia bacterium]